MPLFIEYANYGDWGTDAKRRPGMLYNRPIRSGIDCFVKIEGSETAKIDVEAGGLLKHKMSSEIEDNEKEFLRANRTNQSVMSGCSGF